MYIQGGYRNLLTLHQENGYHNSGVCIEVPDLLLPGQSSFHETMLAEDRGLEHLIVHAGVEGEHGRMLACRSGKKRQYSLQFPARIQRHLGTKLVELHQGIIR
jgi:hypothetical protein